jgi:hypothetical protein
MDNTYAPITKMGVVDDLVRRLARRRADAIARNVAYRSLLRRVAVSSSGDESSVRRAA